ncbi:MAG: hypothetical protein K6E51_02565 [Treponema sp.]|nr:hypothetical protein [Treponema sp.]
MKKVILLYCFALLLCFCLHVTLYAVDFKVIKDTPLYDYFGNIIKEIKKDEVFTVDQISLIHKDDQNTPKTLLEYQTVSGLGTYVQAADVIIEGQSRCPESLQNTIWIPDYYYTIIQTRDKTLLETFDSYYANYEQWRYFTDWDNDDWFAEQTTEMLLFGNSFFVIEGFNTFLGALNFVVHKISDTTLYTTCTLSRSNRYQYVLPKTIQDDFVNNEAYIFTYKIDGDYLYLYYGDRKLVFCKSTIETVRQIRDFYIGKIHTFSDVTYPCHADGSCEYEGH